jgi:hypothetical protein
MGQPQVRWSYDPRSNEKDHMDCDVWHCLVALCGCGHRRGWDGAEVVFLIESNPVDGGAGAVDRSGAAGPVEESGRGAGSAATGDCDVFSDLAKGNFQISYLLWVGRTTIRTCLIWCFRRNGCRRTGRIAVITRMRGWIS